MITIFRCSHCSFESENKDEVTAHEVESHSVTAIVMHVTRKGTQPAQLTALSQKPDGVLLTIITGGELRKRSTPFIVAGEDIRQIAKLAPEGDTDNVDEFCSENDKEEISEDVEAGVNDAVA